MSQRDTQFLELYQLRRYEDQLAYYRSRKKEFEGAQSQAFGLILLLMILASAAAILTSVLVSLASAGWATVCAILAVIFPIFATSISAYDTLYAFERHAKLYEEVLSALRRAHADKPDLTPGLSEADYSKALNDYVGGIERILRTEQGEWAQVANEIQQVNPPLSQA